MLTSETVVIAHDMLAPGMTIVRWSDRKGWVKDETVRKVETVACSQHGTHVNGNGCYTMPVRVARKRSKP